MRIGIVCYPTQGGSGVVGTELGHELAKRGHEVHFIAFEQPFRLRLGSNNIYFHRVEMPNYEPLQHPDYTLPLAVKMAAVCRQYKLEVLHVHYAIPHATAAYLAKKLLGDNAPVVVTTLHGTDITLVGRDQAYYEIAKFSIEQSDLITVVSNYLLRETVECFAINKEIKVIHNFFTPRSMNPCRDQWTEPNEKLIVHASNFRRVKRVPDVINIFAKIRQALPAKLMLVGSGNGVPEAEAMIKELGLVDDVIFQGLTHDVDPFIACADLFLLPSELESFGLAALEALAYGVPVVASSTGGIPELVSDGVEGFLAKPGDIETMSNLAIGLLLDEKLHEKMSMAAKMKARDKFPAEKIVAQYEALYLEQTTL